MTTKDGAPAPADVLVKTMPALSATNDAPTPPPTPTPAKTPDVVASSDGTPPAKSGDGLANSGSADGKAGDGEAGKVGEKKAKNGIEERFSKVTGERKAAEEKAAAAETARLAAEARADRLTQDFADLSKKLDKIIPPEPEDVRPDRAKFDDPNKYDDALATWAGRIGEKKAKAEAEAGFKATREKEANDAAAAANQAEVERVGKEFKTRSDAFMTENADYEDVIKNDEVQITPIMGQAILYSEMGPQIAYHLGKNPDLAAQIAAKPHAMQLIEIGKLEAKLSAPPRTETTKTPAPLDPLKSGRSNAVAKAADEESMDEYAARRQSEMRPAASGSRR